MTCAWLHAYVLSQVNADAFMHTGDPTDSGSLSIGVDPSAAVKHQPIPWRELTERAYLFSRSTFASCAAADNKHGSRAAPAGLGSHSSAIMAVLQSFPPVLQALPSGLHAATIPQGTAGNRLLSALAF